MKRRRSASDAPSHRGTKRPQTQCVNLLQFFGKSSNSISCTNQGASSSSSLPSTSQTQTDSSNEDSESDIEDDSSDSGHEGEGEEQDLTSSTLSADIKSGDLAKIIAIKQHRSLTDQEKFYTLEHSFSPPSGYSFPCRIINGVKRHFQHCWLSKYNGLVYSESADGGYCKYCALFAIRGPNIAEFGVLVNKPFTNFKKASDTLDQHFFGKQFHKDSVQRAMMFKKVQLNQATSIDQQLSILRQEQVKQNRLKLRSIVETIIFCGRQGIALRGHRDDHTQVVSALHSNHGNFLALLQFRVEAGDQVLDNHMKTAQGNAQYTSKTIQNELISICGNSILETLLREIRDAGLYSVIADEATDAANHEQLSISVRYVNKDGAPCERFLGFLKCQGGVTGEAISEYILSQLSMWQLPVTKLRGQSYDGAGAMSGSVRGAAARISAKYPKALYVHCAAHRLNLCVMKCCNNCEISNAMDTVSSISRFFNNSPKRQIALETWITSVHPSEEKRKKLKDLCRTRWIERHDAYDVFIDLYVVLVSCFEDIVHASPTEWNRETRSEAHSFLLALSQFSFIITLVVTRTTLAYTRGLAVKLQGRYVDAVQAHTDIESVKSVLKGCRSNVHVFHERLYQEAVQIGELVEVTESSPRLAGRQQHRSNICADTTTEYYKLNLTIPLLDHIINELDDRFNPDSSGVLQEFIQLLPVAVFKRSDQLRSVDFARVLQLYEDDLPSSSSLDVELELWQAKWKDSDNASVEDLNTPVKVLPHADKDYFPNIRSLVLIMITIPVTSCECERSISLLRLVKSTLRTTMTEERLNGLCLMQYYHDMDLDPDEVVSEFARCHPRRMEL